MWAGMAYFIHVLRLETSHWYRWRVSNLNFLTLRYLQDLVKEQYISIRIIISNISLHLCNGWYQTCQYYASIRIQIVLCNNSLVCVGTVHFMEQEVTRMETFYKKYLLLSLDNITQWYVGIYENNRNGKQFIKTNKCTNLDLKFLAYPQKIMNSCCYLYVLISLCISLQSETMREICIFSRADNEYNQNVRTWVCFMPIQQR